jgi:hypothetical protein
MTRRLNSAGTLSAKHAEKLGALLADRFPPALDTGKPAISTPSTAAAEPSPAKPEVRAASKTAAPARLSKDEFKAMKEAAHAAAWEQQRAGVEEVLGVPLPPLLSERLSSDRAIWCHHALWHSRVYLLCVHGTVGQSFAHTQAASVVAALHEGRPTQPQWRALTVFLEHLRKHGYVDFPDSEARVADVAVAADLQHPPAP